MGVLVAEQALAGAAGVDVGVGEQLGLLEQARALGPRQRARGREELGERRAVGRGQARVGERVQETHRPAGVADLRSQRVGGETGVSERWTR